jgi:AbrB family looped-hinge helix DNA binding protein
MESTLTSKCQVTLPKRIREHLKLHPRDRVKFFINYDGSVAILPVLPITALKGLLKSQRPAISLEEMDEAIAEGAIDRHRRFLGQ